jgi:hypothetical protein
MGTRGTIHFKDGKKTVLSIYMQYDAYPSGIGQALADMLRHTRITNGYSGNMETANKAKGLSFANGIGCLALQLVKSIKDGIGNYYAVEASNRQEFNYFLSVDKVDPGTGLRGVHLKLTDDEGKTLFSGPIAAFDGYALEGRTRPLKAAK